jgi:hypothetical protein
MAYNVLEYEKWWEKGLIVPFHKPVTPKNTA